MNIRLGLCSAYSFLYGVHKPEKIMDAAASYGIKTVSICDIDNLYGVHSFLEAAKERNIRPIIGVALTKRKEKREKGKKNEIIYCFVENKSGFSLLCQLLTNKNKNKENSNSKENSESSEEFDPVDFLQEKSEGLVLASSCEEVLEKLKGKVRHLYAAITPANIKAVSASRKLDIPLAFLDNSVFLQKEDFAVHRVLRAISLLKTVHNLQEGDTAPIESVMRPSYELQTRLDSWPEAVKGTEEIAEICTLDDIFDGWIFPDYEVRDHSVYQELEKRVYKGCCARYGELADRETGRIEYELGIIKEKGFSSYFLIIDDIVRISAKQVGGGRICGRGSGAASIVSYGLGITNVDPLRHDLYFERFLNPSRLDPPDIDIDFAWDERDDLIKAVIERFGHGHCARVANHNFFRYRSALRETAKAYGFGDAEITQAERKLGIRSEEAYEGIIKNDKIWQEIFSIAAKIEGLPHGLGMHCGGLVITPKPISHYAPIEESAEGYPLLAWEKEGTEAAGFVKIDLLGNRSLAVIRDAIANINEQGTMNNEQERNYDIQERLNRAVDDAAVIDALARGDSMGVFYIESPAMRQLQKKTGKGDFEHIVIHSSIIRPAANKFINEYVRRLKGGKWKPLHPRLENILKESYGILCYQEDVSKTAVALADFNEAEADKLRKIIAKKMGGVKLAVYKKQFFDGCIKNGVDNETICKIWDMMLSFDGYSFCKPHSASYAMVSFQSAYLRVYHPAEFMAAVLSNQGGFYRPHAYIAEARRMRLTVTGPDVNVSNWKYYGISNEQLAINNEQLTMNNEQLTINNEQLTISKEQIAINNEQLTISKEQIATNNEKLIMNNYCGTVVVGFMAIKGLSLKGAEAIVEERERNGQFTSLDDFSHRVKLNRDDIIALTPAGVFDSIADGLPREMQARKLLAMHNLQCTMHNEQLTMHNDELFESNYALADTKLVSSHKRGESSLLTAHRTEGTRSLFTEYQALGFLRDLHPLAMWKDDILKIKNRVKAVHIADYIGRNVKLVGWPVTQKDVWTKDGETMCFLSLEDETAMYETVVFPQIYKKYHRLLFDQKPLLVFGKVCNDMSAVSLEITRIEGLV